MILTYKYKSASNLQICKNKTEIVCLWGYLRNFCWNFGKKRNFVQNLDLIECWPNQNRNQKSSFRFRSSRNRNTNLNFGFGILLSKIHFLCSLGCPIWGGMGGSPPINELYDPNKACLPPWQNFVACFAQCVWSVNVYVHVFTCACACKLHVHVYVHVCSWNFL